MKINFLGVGEAFDENHANTSILIQHPEHKLLIDCDYSLPQKLWQFDPNPDLIDSIYLSHAHADHYFGLPPILARMGVDGRAKPLTIIGHEQTLKKAQQIDVLGYDSLLDSDAFKLNWQPVNQTEPLNLEPLKLSFASTGHVVLNLAIRVEVDDKSVCYSGDGRPTDKSLELFKHCDLLVHDCYHLDRDARGHSSVERQIQLAEELKVDKLALVHINRTIKQDEQRKIMDLMKQANTTVFEPNSGDQLEI
jgi:ribonuclease BN (tRNA processing enzyme)